MAAAFLVPMAIQIILAVNFFSPNDYREGIAQEVQRPAAPAFDTRGQVRLLIWPRLPPRITNVLFGIVLGGFASELMSTDHSHADGVIRPLFWDQVDFASLEVNGLGMVLSLIHI